MAEIRCPMCGKPNPAELEICQFCDARLKPLIIKPEEPSEDWLKPFDEDQENHTGLNQPEAPDWLRSLRSREVPMEETNDDHAQSDPAEWLRAGIDDPDILGIQTQPSTNADWLADFRARDIEEDAGDTVPDLQANDAELGDAGQLELPTEADPDLPDWLSRARFGTGDDLGKAEPPEPVQPDHDEDSEWLARIRASNSLGDADQLPSSTGDYADIPDWLKAQGQNYEIAPDSIPSRPGSEDEGPPWTPNHAREANVDDLTAEPGELKPADEDILLPEEDLPDWLIDSSVVSEEAVEPVQPEEESPETRSVDSPPWYATAPGRPFKPTDQLSQWLRLETTDSDTPENTPQEKTLDWLRATEEDYPTQSQSVAPEDLISTNESESSGAGELADTSPDSSSDGEPSQSEFPETSDDAFLNDEFALLAHELFPEGGSDQESVQPAGNVELTPGDEPTWLVELRQKMGEAGDDPNAGKVSPFSEDIEQELSETGSAGQELPDWLVDVHAQEAIEHITEAGEQLEIDESSEKEEAAGLAQADLPSWLEAMRPVEAVAAAASDLVDDRDQSIESAGPLAGIKGVLPVEPDIASTHKPGTFGLKLNVSDMQRARAEMLQELIQKEAEGKPVPRKPTLSSQRILQIVIAVTLILAILSTLIIDTQIAQVPGFPIETGAVSQLISSLSSSDRVLVAIDYQPSFSGEMEAAGTAVLDHLMLRGVQLAFISTHPSGPLQAERLVGLVNQRYGHTYGVGQVTNLGYISGGRAGILAFAFSPRLLAPVTLDTGTNPWDGGSLQGVNQASDFAMAVVITESPDTARMWIEQFQPVLRAKPLIMVLSAQAAPIVRPYYEGSPQQVQGIVSGMVGAAAYENLMGRVGFARSHGGAYSLGILAACILILLGGILNALPVLSARLMKTNPGGDDQL